jgi:hypothetical protein
MSRRRAPAKLDATTQGEKETDMSAPFVPAVRERRELGHRSSNGIDVYLLWSPETDTLAVVVDDARGDSFELVVEAHEALDVFEHPFAYAAYRGLTFMAAAA